jgi:hypothetical protein
VAGKKFGTLYRLGGGLALDLSAEVDQFDELCSVGKLGGFTLLDKDFEDFDIF